MSNFVEKSQLYPLQFTPLYQERMWGGSLMTEKLHRQVPEMDGPVGESWELVDRENEQSVLKNGPMAGKTLGELLHHYGHELIGRKARSTDRFPLLVKLIDAGQRLSLQVHPDEAACAQIGGTAEPKTEMWYIIGALPGGTIMAGLRGRATRQQLLQCMATPDVEDLLQVYPSLPGDAYYITAGTLHAIGEGNLILEIQQNSDTTYRVSDWGRVDANGKSRQLHVEQGLKAINFMNRTSPRIAGVSDQASHNRKFAVVNRCPFFSVDDLRLTGEWNDDTAGQSFHLISAINGVVRCGKPGDPVKMVTLAPGDTALIPAAFGAYVIDPEQAAGCTVIKTTL